MANASVVDNPPAGVVDPLLALENNVGLVLGGALGLLLCPVAGRVLSATASTPTSAGNNDARNAADTQKRLARRNGIAAPTGSPAWLPADGMAA